MWMFGYLIGVLLNVQDASDMVDAGDAANAKARDWASRYTNSLNIGFIVLISTRLLVLVTFG